MAYWDFGQNFTQAVTLADVAGFTLNGASPTVANGPAGQRFLNMTFPSVVVGMPWVTPAIASWAPLGGVGVAAGSGLVT